MIESAIVNPHNGNSSRHSSDTPYPVLVVMGAPGAGKSTVGRALAARLRCPFVDGDDLHPAGNIQKMANGIPLTDADRAPWLAAIADLLEKWSAGRTGGVVACSALKRLYRDRLREGHPDVRFVYLEADEATLHARVAARQNHFIAPILLADLLRVLEPPTADEHPIVVRTAAADESRVRDVVAAQVEDIVAELDRA
jgi:gluconokinase